MQIITPKCLLKCLQHACHPLLGHAAGRRFAYHLFFQQSRIGQLPKCDVTSNVEEQMHLASV